MTQMETTRQEKSEQDKRIGRFENDLNQVNIQQEQLTEEIAKFQETMDQIIE